jgi:hypothetical protein
VSVTQTEDSDKSILGITWGDIDGFQGVSRMTLGAAVSETDLETDWTMTYELVYMGIASLADEHHWFEEGLATYVEPIARAQNGQLPAEHVGRDMVSRMHQGASTRRPRIRSDAQPGSHVLGRRNVLPGRLCRDPASD